MTLRIVNDDEGTAIEVGVHPEDQHLMQIRDFDANGKEQAAITIDPDSVELLRDALTRVHSFQVSGE